MGDPKKTAAIDPQELEAAELAAKQSTDTVTIQLKRPVSYNGSCYETLSFNWNELTGADGLEIENELMARGKSVIVPALSGEYLIRMAARACTNAQIGCDIFNGMSLADYNRIRSAARSFLLRSE